jgi:RND family efflux transporter MFP subunit
MAARIDLRELAVRRESDAPAPPRRSRHLGTRVVFPGIVLAGFVGVMAWAARDRWLPSHPVTVTPVITTRGDVVTDGSPLFQSAAWVEPRPTPILVTALTEGVVEKLLVVEGQKVRAGQPVAQLVQEDARLALQAADADRELRLAEIATAKAALIAAQTNLDKPVQLQAAVAEAKAMSAQKETELAAVPFQLSAARARLKLAEQNFENRKQAFESGATSLTTFNQAKSELESATSAVGELEARQTRLKAEVDAQTMRVMALTQRLELKTDEVRLLAEANAGVKAAEARLKQAQTAFATAQLRFNRTVISAPLDGQVMALVARPGQRLMGQSPAGMQEASTVITMYDPAMLQVRADVRFDDIPKVQPGQRVMIDTPVCPDHPLEGEVLQITSQADIQKNTLQVKVMVKSPPPTLRPDMLVQVTFLAKSSRRTDVAEAPPLRLLIPRSLVETVDGQSQVWAADLAAMVARRKAIKLGRPSGELVEVVDGLNPSDRLIVDGRQGLREGQRITTSDDTTQVRRASK